MPYYCREEELKVMRTCAEGIFTRVFGIIDLKNHFKLRAFFILCFNILSKSLDVMSQEEKLKEEFFKFVYFKFKEKIEKCYTSSFRGNQELKASRPS